MWPQLNNITIGSTALIFGSNLKPDDDNYFIASTVARSFADVPHDQEYPSLSVNSRKSSIIFTMISE